MPMISLIESTTGTQVALCDDDNKPTPLFIALIACELCVDILTGYAAYKFFSSRKK